MAGWKDQSGRAVVLDLDNIDTDQLIPARFMSVPRSEGYGEYLLHDMARNADATLRSDFPLNQNGGFSVLIAGRNFGTGSSREAAVYALVDAGFRCVIAPSFGDIFASNAVNNGLLPAVLPTMSIAALIRTLSDTDEVIEISLPRKQLTCGAQTFAFDLDETWNTKLQNGWDDIDLTMHHKEAIASYHLSRTTIAPWVWPRRQS